MTIPDSALPLPYDRTAAVHDLLQTEDPGRASAAGRRLIAAHPDLADLYQQRAATLLRLDRRDEAAVLLERCLHLDPGRPVAGVLMAIGADYDRAGRLEEAVRIYTAVWEIAGNVDLACPRLIWALCRLRRTDRARAFCHAFLDRLEPVPANDIALDCYLFLIDLGVVDGALLRRGALEWARPILRIDPRNVTAATAIAQYLYLRGRTGLLGRLQRAFFAQFDAGFTRLNNKTKFWHVSRFDDRFFDELPGHAETLAGFPSLYKLGGLDPVGESGVVFISGDEVYFNRYADIFLERLGAVEPGIPVHLHLIDPSDASLAKAGTLKEVWPGPFNVTFEKAEARTGHFEHPDEPKTYYASIRFLRAAQLMPLYRTKLLVIDIDTVLQRDLTAVMETRGADVVVRYGNKMGPTREYLAGAILFAPTAATQRYLELLTRYIGYFLDNRASFWTLDQAALYCCAVHLRRRDPAFAVGFYGQELNDACGFAMGSDDQKASYMEAQARREARKTDPAVSS